MKVLIVTTYESYPGGVERFNNQIEKILKDMKVEVEYLATDDVDNKFLIFCSKVFGRGILTALKYRKIDQSKYDLVICNGEHSLGINHENLINVFHGSYYGLRKSLLSFMNLRQKLQMWIQSKVQKLAAKNKYVITNSQYSADVLKKQGIKTDLIVGLAADHRFFEKEVNHKKRENKLLFVGSFNFYGKGIDILQHLAAHGVEIDCVTDKEPLSNLGHIASGSDIDIEAIYEKYKILLLPSRFESFGLVAAEAMAMGIPVIISNVGIGQELRNEIPEFVIPDWDTEKVNRALHRIEIIMKDWDGFSQKAKEYAERNFSYEDFENKWKTIFSERLNEVESR